MKLTQRLKKLNHCMQPSHVPAFKVDTTPDVRRPKIRQIVIAMLEI
jgi:hypothetical protein